MTPTGILSGDGGTVANECVERVGEGVYQGCEYPTSELPGLKQLQTGVQLNSPLYDPEAEADSRRRESVRRGVKITE